MTEQIIRMYGENWGTTSIEVTVGSTNTAKLPDDSILRDKRIIGMFVANNEDGSAKSISGAALVGDNAVRSSYITIKKGNDEIINEHPLSDFMQTPGDRSIRMLNLCSINPAKSEIVIGDTSLVSSGEVFILQFIYELS